MNRFALIIMTAVLLLSGCRSGGAGNMEQNISSEITISGLSGDRWTYFSFSTGEVVGSSTFLSEEEDEQWRQRRDWDFAICGDYLKTNSGTSGIGNGGVLKDTEHNFLTLDTAPEGGYLTDEVNVVK